MTLLTRLQGAGMATLSILFSLAGVKAANAGDLTSLETESLEVDPIAQGTTACPESWQKRQTYARVVTQSTPLQVRATPGGQVVGSIPKGWLVVVEETNSTGEWTKITSHFGNVDGYGYGSAPDFHDGWVASRFLSIVGDFCEKPFALAGTLLIAAAPADNLQLDWLQMGDRIAQARRQ